VVGFRRIAVSINLRASIPPPRDSRYFSLEQFHSRTFATDDLAAGGVEFRQLSFRNGKLDAHRMRSWRYQCRIGDRAATVARPSFVIDV
jgi:hypothetical protein